MAKVLLRLFALVALLSLGPAARMACAADDVWGRDYLPDVPVVTQDGKTVKFYSDTIEGKLVVISFIYTTCRDICPLVTARMAELQDRLGDAFGRDVFFVSISIDPETDTPERMKSHAEAFNVKPGWLFLTGTRENIDIIRHKLGERSRKLTEHRSEILLRNDRTGEWAKDSVFGDISTVMSNIRAMDPGWQASLANDASAGKHYALAPDGGLPGQALFIRACGGCHTVGAGSKVGPDLEGLTRRRERAWLNSFLTSPQAMRAKGDATALALSEEYKGVRMPEFGLSSNDITDVLSYIEAQSHAARLAAQDAPHDHSKHAPKKGVHDHGAHAHH